MSKILFVCIENSNRSQMAEAFVKMFGKDNVLASSAGSKPSGKINPKAIEAMKKIGYDLTKHHSKSVDDFRNEKFDYAITMGCGDECPFISATHRIDWNIPDPKNMEMKEFLQVRNVIGEKVNELLSEILHESNAHEIYN
ncbi:MAG: arsenate reductase ArsC [Bacteroidia bacterium]